MRMSILKYRIQPLFIPDMEFVDETYIGKVC